MRASLAEQRPSGAGLSRRAYETDIDATGLIRPDQDRLLAGIADAARRRRHAVTFHPADRGVHTARAVEHLKGAGPAPSERLGGGTGLGGLRYCQARWAQVEDRHVRLDDRATLDLGHRHAEHPA